MSRQLEQKWEEQSARRNKQILRAVTGGLAEAVGRSGGILTGYTVKNNPGEVLMVLRAEFPAGPMVAFVGSGDVGTVYVKAMLEGSKDQLRWRADKYAQK